MNIGLRLYMGFPLQKKRLLKEIFHSARAVFNIEETARTSCWFLTETEKETLKAQQKETILDDKCRAWERARKQGSASPVGVIWITRKS